MPFGMAGLDFAFGIRTETERKPFLQKELTGKSLCIRMLAARSRYKTRTIRLGRFVFMYEEVGAKRT